VRIGRITFLVSMALPTSAAYALGAIHGERQLNWQTDQISDVVAANAGGEAGQVVMLDGKSCLEGSAFYFKVRDQYAFDIDEPVSLEVEFYRDAEAAVPEESYGKNDEVEATVKGQIPEYKDGPRIHKETFSLAHARFANRGMYLSDFSIGLGAAGYTGKQKITICNISLKRSYATAAPQAFGNISLEVIDETGKIVPARVGIYDKTGRLPLPSEEALASKRFNDVVRVVTLNRENVVWPHVNPSVFYIRGSYHAKLPEGTYELIVAKGPEYRIKRQAITVEGDKTQSIRVKLQRWADLPAKGWISGDVHIHYSRENRADDDALLVLAAAEDLHVANILQMGHAGGAAFPQYSWNPVSSDKDSTYLLVPGQEDPRTNRRGAAMGLNLRSPVRLSDQYFLYHTAFEQVRAQGGVTGYANLLSPEGFFYARTGLALDVPFGLVDFAELMKWSLWSTETWFDLLNLGYKLLPAAGSDYPYMSFLGAERSYVRVRGPLTRQAWFEGWKRGEVFVSNGPILEFSVNGKGMGSELRLRSGEKLTINAKATINPDIDTLDRLELIEHGEVVKSVQAAGERDTRLQLTHELRARQGSWFIVRAYGRKPRSDLPMMSSSEKNAKAAFSAPVYVYVDDKGFWKPAAVPAIVARFKQDMTKLLRSEGGPETCTTETWDAGEPCVQNWEVTKGALQQRVQEVSAMYDDLLSRANADRTLASN
jgi:hypothetical protein